MTRRVSLVFGLLSAAIGALGTIQTFVQVGTGREFSLQLLGFWIGASAVSMYVAAAVGLAAGGILYGAIDALSGKKEVPDSVIATCLGAGGLVGVAFAVVMIMQGVLFDYDNMDGIGRGTMGVLGLAALGLGIWVWRRGLKAAQAKGL